MVRPPRGSTRSSKFVKDQAQTTSGTAKANFVLAVGVDNDSLGQTGATDGNVPTGSKIKQFNIMSCWGSITGVSTFVHWSIQRLRSGQSSISPISVGGNPQRSCVMMQGMQCVGEFQNAHINVKYKVPKAFQRVADGDQWMFVTLSSTNVDTVKQVIYKVFV